MVRICLFRPLDRGEAAVARAFQAVLEAESAGANVSALLERLDVAAEQAGRDSEYIGRMMYRDISESDYLRMVEAKTAVLFKAACEAGGIVGGGKPRQIKALSMYGFNCGVAFQIQDDILDVVGETERLGKEAGKDIREHKLGNVMVLYSLEELSENSRDRLLMMLRSPKLSDAEVGDAVEIVLSTNAVERAQEASRAFISKAKSELKILPESEAKSILMSVADFVVERSF